MNLRNLRLLAPAALALAAGSAIAGSMATLYENSEFKGRSVLIGGDVANVTRPGYVDPAASIVVAEGAWEVCTGTNYRGTCAQLPPGNYPTIDESLNGKIASIRRLPYTDVPARVVAQPYVVLADPRPIVVDSSAPLVVTEPLDTRRYVVVSPSPTVAPDNLAVAPPAATASAVVQPVVGRAVLYEYPNFGGSRAVVDRGQAKDLDWTNFRNPNHRATSISIESGTWVICTDIGFQGECRMLGPGEYPELSGALAMGISSAQQVWRPEGVSLNVYTR
jgi:hypothetical protein